MEIYLLKTQYNQSASDQFQLMVQMFSLDETIIEEAFSDEGEAIRKAGVVAIPSLVAITHDAQGEIVILAQASHAGQLPSFEEDAQTALEDLTS